MRTVPLFLLKTVLFPGMWMPLHIFEERYKQMLEDCRQGDGSFGVALIREGEEVGETAEPFMVGTMARIQMVRPLPLGRFLVQTQGEERFRVQRLRHDRAYLQAEVQLVDEPRSRRNMRARRLMAQAFEAYKRYLDLLRSMGGHVGEVMESALDPDFLSWLIASTLMVDAPIRQEMLELDSVEDRLQREMEILAELIPTLEARAAKPPAARSIPFSLN